MPETIQKMKSFRRFIENADIVVRKEGDKKTLTFPASSEAKVERWYGDEILSHDKKAIRLDRAKRGAMPLLFNHGYPDADPIGMVDAARIEDNRLMIDAHLFDTDRAKQVATMIDGGLRNVSIAYRVYVIEEDKKGGTFTLTDWEPFEVSIVSVPADATVGIGRDAGEEFEVRMVRTSQPALNAKGVTVEKETTDTATENAGNKDKKPPDITGGESRSGLDLEKARMRCIENLCKMNKLDEQYRDMWVGQGLSIEQVSDEILRIIEERGKTNPQPISRLGLSSREAQQFSLVRAISACADKDWKNAGYELECSRTIAEKMNRAPDPRKFFVPFEVMQRQADLSLFDQNRLRASLGLGQRDLTVATAGAGGFLVSTDNVGFIEMLRNRSVAFRMGVRRLSGLTGNVTIPRQSAAGTAFWLATEATAITEGQQTFVQVALTPKTVGAYTEISRLLLLQSSPGVEGIVTDDLAQTVATAADLGVLNGSGAAGQPTGIFNTAGVGTVVGTTIGFAGILEYQTDVAAANVMPARGGYVTTPAVAALLMQRVKFTSTASPLWEGNVWDGAMVGFPAMSSNQMPAASQIFGDWQECVVGEWGVLEVEVNPYANFQAGIIGVRAMYSLDVGVRRPFAFSVTASGIT